MEGGEGPHGPESGRSLLPQVGSTCYLWPSALLCCLPSACTGLSVRSCTVLQSGYNNRISPTLAREGFFFCCCSCSSTIPPLGVTGYWIYETYKQKLKARTIGFLNALKKRHRFTVAASPFHRKGVTVSPWKSEKGNYLASPFHRSKKRKTQDFAGMAVGEGWTIRAALVVSSFSPG